MTDYTVTIAPGKDEESFSFWDGVLKKVIDLDESEKDGDTEEYLENLWSRFVTIQSREASVLDRQTAYSDITSVIVIAITHGICKLSDLDNKAPKDVKLPDELVDRVLGRMLLENLADGDVSNCA